MDSSISSSRTEEFLAPPPIECNSEIEEDFEFGNFYGIQQSFSLADVEKTPEPKDPFSSKPPIGLDVPPPLPDCEDDSEEISQSSEIPEVIPPISSDMSSSPIPFSVDNLEEKMNSCSGGSLDQPMEENLNHSSSHKNPLADEGSSVGDQQEYDSLKAASSESISPSFNGIEHADNANDEDFGDFETGSFGSFENAPNTKYEDFSSSKNHAVENVEVAPIKDSIASVTENSDDDDLDFGSFEEFQSSTGFGNAQNEDDFSDFGDFSSVDAQFTSTNFDCSKSKEVGTFPTNCSQQINQMDSKYDMLLNRWINKMNPENDVEVESLHDVVEGDAFVWSHLQNVESCSALQVTWANTFSNKLFLNAIGVDARNILYHNKNNSSVPLFAQTLSFSPLTPAKSNSKSQPPTWNSENEVPPTVKMEEFPVNKPSPNSFKKPEAIPPAQFDWSSSGLTNPLESPGLEEEILNEEPKRSPKVTQMETPSIIKKILEGPISIQKVTPLDTLSPEVRELLKELPNISFMKSKVLMFPILD